MYFPVGVAIVHSTDQRVGAVVCRSEAKRSKLKFSNSLADVPLSKLGLSVEHSLSHSRSMHSNALFQYPLLPIDITMHEYAYNFTI